MPKSCATLNCPILWALKGLALRVFAWLWCGAALISVSHAAVETNFLARAELAYTTTKASFADDSSNATNAWIFARSCFDLAEFARNNSEREKLGKEGVAAANAALDAASNLAPAYYYRAMNSGQIARTKTLGALPMVEQMEKDFLKAQLLDPTFDYGGPDRSLGLLYLDAPGWPASIGNKKKARVHLEKALALHPEFPENHICLLEALIKMKDVRKARELLPKAEQALKKARTDFTGERWEQSWADWEKRWRVVQHTLR